MRANAVRDQGRSHGDRRARMGISSAHARDPWAPSRDTCPADRDGRSQCARRRTRRSVAPAARLPGCPVAGSVLDPCLTCRPEPPRGKRMQRLPVGARLRANAVRDQGRSHGDQRARMGIRSARARDPWAPLRGACPPARDRRSQCARRRTGRSTAPSARLPAASSTRARRACRIHRAARACGDFPWERACARTRSRPRSLPR